MADPRFYEALGPVALGTLARALGIEVADPDRMVSGLAPLDTARAGDVAFLEGAKGTDTIPTEATAVLVRAKEAARLPSGVVALVVDRPRAALAVVAPLLVRLRLFTPGAPLVDPTAVIEDGVVIAPGAVVGPEARIGSGTRVGANAVIGPGVPIGRNCTIGNNVTLLCALVGDRVSIGSGSVIGEAGFGVALGSQPPVDVPQLGRVIVQQDVSIGALVAIDRGAFGDTVIGEGTKIDNLVQIGHNGALGRGVIVAAQTGLSGSVTVGDGAILGGQVGIADHTEIGAGAVLMAKAGVFGDIPGGEMWGGYPARPRSRWLREAATVSRLAKGKGRSGGKEGDGRG